MIAALAALALAGPPADGLRAVVARPAAAEDYRAWLALHARPPATLACSPGWPGLALLCFRVWEPVPGDAARRSRRWVSSADLTAWGIDAAGLQAAVDARARTQIAAATSRQIVGMKGSYLEIVDGDGASAAALLHPDLLAARLGGPPIAVALPSDAVMLAWKPGGDDVDLAMAVGVHEVFTAAETPVTEVVHLWDGAAWTAWAMTQPVAPAP
jgi:hypothetical protein